jgi:hypothetical protein
MTEESGERKMSHEEHKGHEGHEGREALTPRVERAASILVGAGLKVHRALGPGLLESAYEQCLAHELGLRGLSVRRQVALPVVYEGVAFEGDIASICCLRMR